MRLRCARSWWRVRATRVPSARAGRYVAPAALQPAATPGRDGRHLTAPASKRHTRCHIRPGTTTTKRSNAGLRRRRIPSMIAFTMWPGQSGRVLWRLRGGVSLAHSRCRVASIWRSGRCEPSVRARPSGRGRIVGFDRRPEEDVMESVGLLDRAGRRRSQATLSGFHQGRVPRNKGSCRRRHEPFYADCARMPTWARNVPQSAMSAAVTVCMIAPLADPGGARPRHAATRCC